MSLNEQQRGAVLALAGPVRISAGAGSGKTRTLAERFAHALTDAPEEGWAAAGADEILTITFTEKAAGEIAERVRVTLRAQGMIGEARSVDSAWISTIHGFCSRLLRRYALEAGLDPAFGVADTVQSGRLLEAAFEDAARGTIATEPGAELFGAFEFDAVFAAAERIVRELRSRGLGPDALHIEPARPAVEVYRETIELFRAGGEELSACGDASPSTTGLLACCADLVSALACVDPAALPPAELGRETWNALRTWRKGRSNKVIESLRERLIGEHGRLLHEAAAVAAEPYARAMVDLVTRFMAEYVRMKRERDLLDFDDLQVVARDLLRSDARVRRDCSALFRMVMVDEFQDTDALQAALMSAVAGSDLCTVGDEHQAIYGFRGADIEVYRAHNHEMDAAGARRFPLEFNYRSHPDILGFVNDVFGCEDMFGDSLITLRPGRSEPETPVLDPAEPRLEVVVVRKERGGPDPREAEAASVAARLASLRDANGIPAGHMAVLLRSYTHAEAYARALRRQGFTVAVVGGGGFLRLPEVCVARALVRAIANPLDEPALTTVLASDAGRMTDDGLWVLTHALGADGRGLCLAEALAAPPATLAPRDAARASVVHAQLAAAREHAGREPLADTLLSAIEGLGYDLLLLGGGDEGRQAFANVLRFARLAVGYEADGGAGLAGFSRHVDALERFGERTPPVTLSDEGSSAVSIMSIHASKGLEFPVIAVAGLGRTRVSDSRICRTGRTADGRVECSVRLPDDAKTEERWPTAFSRLARLAVTAEVEEEKRLLYVACTRAKEYLLLSGTADTDKDPSETDVAFSWIRSALTECEGGTAVTTGGIRVAHRVVDPCGDGAAAGEAEAQPDDGYEPDVPDVRLADAVAVTPVAPDTLSYSDIALMRRCALRFRAERVLRVGMPVAPDDGPRTFGSAVHAVLQLAEGVVLPSDERIAAIVRGLGLPEVRADGVRDAAAAFTGSGTAERLEAMGRVRREWHFGVRVGGTAGVDLVGTLDAYGRAGGDGLVVDYKTGDGGPSEDARERYALQARCYALAALHDGCERVEVVFSHVSHVGDDGRPQETVFRFSGADADAIAEEILAAHAEMAAGRCEPLGSWDESVCGDCPIADGVCALSGPGGAGRR